MVSRESAEQKRDRWDRLVDEYGQIKATRYYWLGEPKSVLTENDPKLPWYSQAIFYAASAATLLVFASGDIVALQHANYFRAAVIAMMILLLLVLVYAMDKTTNRTIPRMFVLLQRRQYGMFIEHMLYVGAVSAIEMITLFVVIIHENDIDSILAGKPLIAPGSFWFLALAGSRVFLAMWTIIHSYFVNQPMSVQWGTLQDKLTQLVGGKAMDKAKALDLNKVGLGPLVEALVLFFHPAKHAPRTWKPGYNRFEAQADLDMEHRKLIITTLEALDNPPPPHTIVIPEPMHNETAPVEVANSLADENHGMPQQVVVTIQPQTSMKTVVRSSVALPILSATDPRLSAYDMPSGWSMTELYSQSAIREAFGYPAGTLSNALVGVEYRPGENNSKWYELWQIFALIDAGKLQAPAGFSSSEPVAVAAIENGEYAYASE